MKNKNLIILAVSILIIALVIYTIINKKKNNIIVETSSTTTTTKLALCSNEYYKTKYDEDGKIIIKDFPYYEIYGYNEDSEDASPTIYKCNDNEISEDMVKGCDPYLCKGKRCYAVEPALHHISDLTCVQKLELSGIKYNAGEAQLFGVRNCFFEKDDLNNLSNLINLEEITFFGCSNDNINND